MLTKHLKRQIISLEGGWKVIADLNAYRAFAVTLRQASVTPYFDALKMLGNLYIVDNPKELATMVRDATDFGGLISPEDLYEYLKVSQCETWGGPPVLPTLCSCPALCSPVLTSRQ
jgi:recyclin-1